MFDNLGLHKERARNALAFQFRDKGNPRESFSSSDAVLLVQTKSAYFGYEVISSVGFHRRQSESRDKESRLRNEKLNRFFVTVVGAY